MDDKMREAFDYCTDQNNCQRCAGSSSAPHVGIPLGMQAAQSQPQPSDSVTDEIIQRVAEMSVLAIRGSMDAPGFDFNVEAEKPHVRFIIEAYKSIKPSERSGEVDREIDALCRELDSADSIGKAHTVAIKAFRGWQAAIAAMQPLPQMTEHEAAIVIFEAVGGIMINVGDSLVAARALLAAMNSKRGG